MNTVNTAGTINYMWKTARNHRGKTSSLCWVIEKVDEFKKSYQRLEKAEVKDSTGALIVAASGPGLGWKLQV